MIVPSKFISLDRSVLKKSLILLKNENLRISVSKLYEDNADKFESIDEFMLSLETLWVLGKISVDLETGLVSYAN